MIRARVKPLTLFWCVFALFTVTSLWPIWSERFPPMQDYPVHLLEAYLVTPHGRANFDFERYFVFNLKPTYAAFHVVTALCANFVPIETAGKLGISLYVLLMATVAATVARRSLRDATSWGALLFFPFAFNQQYFLGMINYCYSLPLLWLALIHLETLAAQPLSLRRVCSHIALLAALVLAHPFALLIYLVFAAAAFLWRQDRAQLAKIVPFQFGILALLLLWLAPKLRNAYLAPGHVIQWMGWKPVGETLGFFCAMFTGMRWHDGQNPTTLVLWLVVLGCASVACIRERTWAQPRFRKDGLLLILAVLGLLILPFNINDPSVTLYWTFISLRLASVSYLALAYLISTIRFRDAWAVTFVACVGLLLLQSVGK